MSYPVPANINHGEYIIPGRVIKQLIDAVTTPKQPTDLELLLKFLDASGIEYDWEEYTCGNPDITQVWFHPPHGWELVFEFDRETGKYRDMYLEA